METIVLIAVMGAVILGMIFICFFTSGIEWGIAGSVFEKKSTPEQRAAKAAKEAEAREAEERGMVSGGQRQAV